jgi:glycosyltransferase involved in cell wall biosynthesis
VKPVLFLTNHVPPDRVGAFAALHEAQDIELAVYGGRLHHAVGGVDDPGVPSRRIRQREAHGLAASGRYRAVIATSAGRVAPLAAVTGARRAGIPLLWWTGIWAPIRTPAHLAATPLTRAVERSAGAVVVYGTHVAAYLAGHGVRNIHVAPQAVDGAFWGADADPGAARTAAGDPAFLALFAGRDIPGKGLTVLLDAWERGGFAASGGRLALAGVAASAQCPVPAGAILLGQLPPDQLRNFHAAADVLVVPSIPTRDFREPWGLVVNEAMHQGTAVIATDAVGAAAGGLVRDDATGLVVPAGDADALAAALTRVRDDGALRARLGAAGRDAVAGHTFQAWAAGFTGALATVSAGRGSW